MNLNRVASPVFKASVTAGLLALALALGVPVLLMAQGPAVRTTGGLVSGVALSHGIEIFRGISFAAPPVGKLRWRPPHPPATWKGVRKADHFGPPCMQPASPERLGPWTRVFLSKLQPSEDCLYLNIWTASRRPAALRPVMVWIYGGGFTSGAGSVAIYDGAALAQKGVVIVNVNYRVGAFGFLAYRGLSEESAHHSSGNYALLDQIAALRWVERNIAAFGGDPQDVTIFGQSAGAISVWLLMQSPLARGLFEKAIIMSGPGVLPIRGGIAHDSLAVAENDGQHFAARLRASSVDDLRALPAERIVQASEHFRWGPISDGWVLRAGWQPRHEVPVINGMVADDIGIGYYGNGPAPVITVETYKSRLKEICGGQLNDCLKLYPAAGNKQAAGALLSALQDRARVSLYKWAERQTSLSPEVYLYYFDREIPWPQHPNYRVFHSSDLPYVFDNLRILRRPWQPADWRVAQQMSSYWTSFANTGSPNETGLPAWPAFHGANFTIMQLGARMGPMLLASRARLRFWMKELKIPLGL